VSAVLWAVNSFNRSRNEIAGDLRKDAELDLLHARLNHIATPLGAPRIGINEQLEQAIEFRKGRVAHLTGLEEFAGSEVAGGSGFWDEIAMGAPGSPPDDDASPVGESAH
jgi:hypothetical protein